MEIGDFCLAVIPPALAIAIEVLNPCNERYFAAQASRVVATKIGRVTGPCTAQVDQARELAEIALKTSMLGAASIAGLAPTIVSFVLSAITVFFAVEKPFPWLTGLAVIAILTVLLVLVTISGKTVFDLESDRLVVFGRPTICATRFFSWLIYLTNAVVIAGFSSVYFKWLA